MNFDSLVKCFGIIMNIAKKIQSLVRSQTLFVLRSLVGLENQVKWTWPSNGRSGETDESRTIVI